MVALSDEARVLSMGKFLTINSVFKICMQLRLSIAAWVSFHRLLLQRAFPCHTSCRIRMRACVHSTFSFPVNTCNMQRRHLSSLLLAVCIFSLFLPSRPGSRYISVLDLPKNWLLLSLIFSIILLFDSVPVSVLILIISSLLLTVGLISCLL